MLFTILTATTSRNSAHTAWERNGKSLSETSLQMRSSLTEKIYNSRKSLLMCSSPWCQAGLSVQLADIISCPVPAGSLLFWSHCCRNAGQAPGCPAQDSQVCSTASGQEQAQLPRPVRHARSTQAFFAFKAVEMSFPKPRNNLCFCCFYKSPSLWLQGTGTCAQGTRGRPTALGWSQAEVGQHLPPPLLLRSP